MKLRCHGVLRGRASAVGMAVFVCAFAGREGGTTARAQRGGHSQAKGGPVNDRLRGNGSTSIVGRYWPAPVKDPTALERGAVAAGIYRGILDELNQKAVPKPGAVAGAPAVDTQALFEISERLGRWSLRWQKAEDNAAKTRAARYQSMWDHFARMTALEEGRDIAPGEPRAAHYRAEIARYFRPIDGSGFDMIVDMQDPSELRLNATGVRITPAEQVEIAGRVYRAILDEAAERFRVGPRGARAAAEDRLFFDAALAERLGLWSELWERSAFALALKAPPARSPVASNRFAWIKMHIARMADLEKGRLKTDVANRAGRRDPGPGDIDPTAFPEFVEIARFFRIEAESKLPGASLEQEDGVSRSGQAATARRFYQDLLDTAARLVVKEARAAGRPADPRAVFDVRLAERLAAWSTREARARMQADPSASGRFNAVRSHIERVAALEDGRALREAFKRAGLDAAVRADNVPPREFADVAQFFRLEALWELELVRVR
jgi:hypothetical protein